MPLHSLFYADDFHLRNEPQPAALAVTDYLEKQQACAQSILPLKIPCGKNIMVPVII